MQVCNVVYGHNFILLYKLVLSRTFKIKGSFNFLAGQTRESAKFQTYAKLHKIKLILPRFKHFNICKPANHSFELFDLINIKYPFQYSFPSNYEIIQIIALIFSKMFKEIILF